MVDIPRLRKLRLDSMQSYVKRAGVDAIIVNTWDNMRYITDVRPPILLEWYIDGYQCVLTADKPPVVIGYGYVSSNLPGASSLQDSYNAKLVPSPAYSFFPAMVVLDDWADIIAKQLAELGVKSGRIGVDYMSYAMQEKLKHRLPGAAFIPVYEDLLAVRAVKNEQEIELARKAAEIVDYAMTKGLRSLRAGQTEREFYGSLVAATLEAGSEGVTFSSISSSGKRSLETEFPTDARIEDGDFVFFDIGSVYYGYNGDAARTGLVGKTTEEGKNLYNDLHEALYAGIDTVKPGIFASEIDSKVRSTLREKGRTVYQHPTGHGVGIKGLELPWIASKGTIGSRDQRLQPGMILALEPRAQANEVGVIRLEDMVLVTEAGHEVLTKTEFLDF